MSPDAELLEPLFISVQLGPDAHVPDAPPHVSIVNYLMEEADVPPLEDLGDGSYVAETDELTLAAYLQIVGYIVDHRWRDLEVSVLRGDAPDEVFGFQA